MTTVEAIALEYESVGERIVVASVPVGGEVKGVFHSQGTTWLWVLGSTTAGRIKRRYRLVRTDEEVTDSHLRRYVGTCRDGGNVAWHVFEAL